MSSSTRIGLALSGGGFRATLFHLGVVRFLRDADLLNQVHYVTSVSGGSILAAHLGLHWKRYLESGDSFEKCASEVISFAQSDVRGRVVRRVLLSWLLVVPALLSICASLLPNIPRWLRWTLFSTQLQREYERIFKGAELGNLPAFPRFEILATSMNTGWVWSFTRKRVEWRDANGSSKDGVDIDTVPLAYAVAASSAFPHCSRRCASITIFSRAMPNCCPDNI